MKGTTMNHHVGRDSLVQAIRDKDYAAQVAARGGGPAAARAIAPLLYHPDEQVRELAVFCLIETGGSSATSAALALACLDPVAPTAATAARALRQVAGAAMLPIVIDALALAPAAFARRELALFVGEWGGAEHIPLLQARQESESSPTVRDALLAARARLGDVEARELFADALIRSEGFDRKAWLSLADYIAAPWLLGPLGELLEDTSPMLRLGGEDSNAAVKYLRTCDVTVDLIARIARTRFSFEVGTPTNYAAEHLEEVRRFVWS